MTPRSIAEYLEALRPRYRGASRSEKAAMLTEAERVAPRAQSPGTWLTGLAAGALVSDVR